MQSQLLRCHMEHKRQFKYILVKMQMYVFYPHMPIGNAWIYHLLFVCLFVCMVTDISDEDKARGVKFCTVVLGRPGRGSPILGYFFPQKPKIGQIGVRRVDIGSACVDNHQSPSLTVFVCVCVCVCLYGYGFCVFVVAKFYCLLAVANGN